MSTAPREWDRLLTELAVARHEAEALQERLGLVGRAAKVGLWEYDFITDRLWISEELAAMYGLDRDTLTWPEFIGRLHPDDVIEVLERPTPSLPFGEPNEFLFRVRHADGRYRKVRSRSVTHGVGDTPTRKLGLHIDMTEDELLTLTEELTEANHRLAQFAEVAGHDLRSPLRAVRRSLQMLTEDAGDALSDAAAEHLTTISGKLIRMERLVDDLLRYAVGRDEDDQDLVDVEQLVADVVDTVDPGPCSIVADVALPDPVWIEATPLTMCVRNLVDNACKHHDGPEGTVTVQARLVGSWLKIDVTDDGPGIESGQLRRIFEPFVTSDPDRTSGLGLAKAQTTARSHDGSLTARSEPGAGSTFTLLWPVGASATGRAERGASAERTVV